MIPYLAVRIVAAAIVAQQPLKGLDPLFPGSAPAAAPAISPLPAGMPPEPAAAPGGSPARDARAAVAEGEKLLREKKFEEALAVFKRAMDLDPKSANAYNGAGCCYYAGGKIDIAIGAFKKASACDPGMSSAYFNLGRCYATKKQWDMAIIQYGKAVKDNPKYGAAHFELANSYYLTKDFKNARIHYEKAAAVFGEKTPQGEESLRNAIKVETLMKRMGG
ncbi:MAG: tetratricopeptide repeat protein [Chlamydiota bacterium]